MTCFWWFLHNFTWSCFTSSPPLYPSQPFSLTLRPRRVRNLHRKERGKKRIHTRVFAHVQTSFAIATKRGKFIVNWGIAVLMLGCKGGFTSLFNPLSGESFFFDKVKKPRGTTPSIPWPNTKNSHYLSNPSLPSLFERSSSSVLSLPARPKITPNLKFSAPSWRSRLRRSRWIAGWPT